MNDSQKSLSLTHLALRKLRKHRLAMAGLYVLLLLYVTCFIFPDFVAPYHFDNERRAHSYHPPSRVHLFDEAGRLHWPFVYRTSFGFDRFYNRIFKEDKSKMYPIKLLPKGDKHMLLGFIPTHVRLFGLGEQADDPSPARLYLLGADARGRDLLSRMLYAGRISLSIGLVGVAVSFSFGMLVGGLSGYYGGITDNIVQRICEMIMMVPSFFLMLALRSSLPMDMSSVQVYFMLVVIMSFIGWAGMARVVRGMVLSIRSNEYIEAARAIGQKDLKIIVHHILPQTFSYAIVSITLSIPGYILGESALSLLGLGIQDPYASWGNLLRDAMSVSEIRFHPWILIPGIFIFLTVMSFNFLGDGLRDAFDPKSQLVGKEFGEVADKPETADKPEPASA